MTVTMHTLPGETTDTGLVHPAIWLARARAATYGIYATGRELYARLVQDPSCPTDMLDAISYSDEDHIRIDVAGHANTSTSTLTRLLDDQSHEVWHALAGRDDLTAETYLQLVRKGDSGVADSIMWNPHLPGPVIEALWSGASEQEQVVLARNPGCPQHLLAQAARCERLVGAVGINPSTPASLLQDLWDGTYREQTGSCLEMNPNTPGDILEKLYQDRRGQHLHLLANPSCPEPVLELATERAIAAGTASADIVKALVANQNLPVELAWQLWCHHLAWNAQPDLARQPWCPAGLRELGVQSGSFSVRASVARNPNLNDDQVQRLAHDPHTAVRTVIWTHPKMRHDLIIHAPWSDLVAARGARSDLFDPVSPAIEAAALALVGNWGGSYSELLEAARLLSLD